MIKKFKNFFKKEDQEQILTDDLIDAASNNKEEELLSLISNNPNIDQKLLIRTAKNTITRGYLQLLKKVINLTGMNKFPDFIELMNLAIEWNKLEIVKYLLEFPEIKITDELIQYVYDSENLILPMGPNMEIIEMFKKYKNIPPTVRSNMLKGEDQVIKSFTDFGLFDD